MSGFIKLYLNTFAMNTPSASTVIDSLLFRDAFSTPAMRAVFADQTLVAHYIKVEVALARAQARCSVIPLDAAQAIARCDTPAILDALDFNRLREDTNIVGYPILPLVQQLAEQCGDAGRYLHWGATTQDIMDTATVLQVRDALALVEADIAALRTTLRALAERHRDTPMPGRTHLQHALPITFGYKAAIWLAMFDRHAERLTQLRARVLVGQLGGAAGTLASLGEGGLAVQAAFMQELDLGVPATTWHVARDGLAEVVNFLALLTSSLGKIACDVMLLSATEFGEVSEPFVLGRGASSTMPQKRNAISSELMLAAAKAVRQHAALMLDAAVQDLERATGPWHAEWIALPESFVLTAGALYQARTLLDGLVVNPARMASNLALTGGLIVAEAVMMALAPHTGRQQAHDIVYGACRSVYETGGTLAEALARLPEVTTHFDPAALASLCDPRNYLGCSSQMVDRAVALSRAQTQTQTRAQGC